MKAWITTFLSQMMKLMAQAQADKGHKRRDHDGEPLRYDKIHSRQR